ncbi:MAG: penicillin-binding protein 2 [Actinobacteria bacterium]|nr:penicillin-binding protein 2 [Actinomycetota bacterium]
MLVFRHDFKDRFAIFTLIVLVVFAALALRLWGLQVLSGAEYAALAEDNRIREIALDAPRGRILDRNGELLVNNRSSMAVVAMSSVKNDDDILVALSNLLQMPHQEIYDRIASVREAPLKPRIVAIDVSTEAIAYLAENQEDFPGVDIRAVPVREYPNGAIAAHVLGYTGEISDAQLSDSAFEEYEYGDLVGKTGAELQFESVLQGDRGFRRVEVDASGRLKRVIEEIEPVPGRDVVLTIDLKVQKAAEEALSRALQEARLDGYKNAKAAAAIAMDARTGEVLALASLPTYDPEMFVGGISKDNWRQLTAEGSEYPLTNRVLAGLYPPASTFKVVTGFAGMANGLTGINTTYRCQGRWVEMGERWPKFCWDRGGHGTLSFSDAMSRSCNVVFYELGHAFYRQEDNTLQDYAKQWGFGSETGIDLPGEKSGRIPDAQWKAERFRDFPEQQTWLPGEAVDLAIGQGDVLATPLQVAAAYAGVANDGAIMRPTIFRQVLDTNGNPVLEGEPQVAFEPDTSAENLQSMIRMLERVTTDGTAKGAFGGFPIRVAGKTGTAQVANRDDFAWFVGFAPADDPRYVVAVLAEQAGGGGAIAAPAAREVFSALFDLPIERVTATDQSR